MSFQNQGFCLFITVLVLNVLGLLLDWYLYSHGHATITQHVWKHPWLGAPIVGLQLAGLFGLVLHFYFA